MNSCNKLQQLLDSPFALLLSFVCLLTFCLFIVATGNECKQAMCASHAACAAMGAPCCLLELQPRQEAAYLPLLLLCFWLRPLFSSAKQKGHSAELKALQWRGRRLFLSNNCK